MALVVLHRLPWRLLPTMLAVLQRLFPWLLPTVVAALRRPATRPPRVMATALRRLVVLPRPLPLCPCPRMRLRNSDACLLLGILHRQVLQFLRQSSQALRDHLLLIQVHPHGFLILERLFI